MIIRRILLIAITVSFTACAAEDPVDLVRDLPVEPEMQRPIVAAARPCDQAAYTLLQGTIYDCRT